jgi:hypothetical protein
MQFSLYQHINTFTTDVVWLCKVIFKHVAAAAGVSRKGRDKKRAACSVEVEARRAVRVQLLLLHEARTLPPPYMYPKGKVHRVDPKFAS